MNSARIDADWPAPPSVVAGTIVDSTTFSEHGLEGRPLWLDQVHGSQVVPADRYAEDVCADASVADGVGDICVVRTADCLPVLFCSKAGDEVAAAHAGWRGLAAGILENTVGMMRADSDKILAWFGPAISQPAFEVGGEVRAAFVEQDAAASGYFCENTRGRWQADLFGLARQRLTAVGVREIFGGGLCTFRDVSRFPSYRRDPDCGRMASFVGLIGP